VQGTSEVSRHGSAAFELHSVPLVSLPRSLRVLVGRGRGNRVTALALVLLALVVGLVIGWRASVQYYGPVIGREEMDDEGDE
jgi:hypothetical protein